MSTKCSEDPLTIFTLTSARSGTLHLRSLFRNNVRNCVCRHEPFFDWGNPTLFGPAIYDAYAGRMDRIRARLARKRDYIRHLGAAVYLESSHAFLKSAYVAALEFFPGMGLIHLIRDPLMVAKSEAYREQWRRQVHAPFHYYWGDDRRRHFCWSLTTNEAIFNAFDPARLSLFQSYLIQWIEIENRAMDFMDRHGLHGRCFTLDSPRDLNDGNRLRVMFEFFGLEIIGPRLDMAGRKNRSLGHTTVITPADEEECEFVLEHLPGRYLDIFWREPYTQFGWSTRFRRSGFPSGKDLRNVA